MKIDIKKIARLARVSPSTVSRYFNHPEKLAEATKEKIHKVIVKYGYFPNEMARSLRSSKKNMVAIIIQEGEDIFLTSPYFTVFANEVTREFAKEGYYTIIAPEEYPNKPHIAYRNLLQKNLVDGFIVMGMVENDKRMKFLMDRDEQFVTIGHNPEFSHYTWVDCDNEAGGYLATRHLMSLGCKNILIVNGNSNDFASQKRLKGYLKALEEDNREINRDLIFLGDVAGMILKSNFSEDECFKILEPMIKNRDFDGVFANSDVSAISILKSLAHLKVKLPVVGFDDVSLANISQPTLTTVRQPIRVIARKAAQKLIQKINGENPDSEMLPVELIVRESTNYLLNKS